MIYIKNSTIDWESNFSNFLDLTRVLSNNKGKYISDTVWRGEINVSFQNDIDSK